MLNNVHPPGEGDRHMNNSPLPPSIPPQFAPQSHSNQLPLPHLAPPRSISRSGSPFPEHMQHYVQQQQPQYQHQQQLQRPPLPQGYSSNGSNQGQGQGQRSQSPFGATQQQQQQMQVQDTRTQLFVSNLPFRVRWQDLKDLMRKCGTVLRADVALSPTDGRSRGFGVVLFARAEDAAKAIGVYHGYTWQTRLLDVRIDTQDPTGALALAEANRQQALQQQREVYQNLASRMSPVPPHPPLPPPTQPLQHYTTNGGIQPQSSPYLGATHLSPPQRSASPLVGTHSSPLLNPTHPPSHSTSHSPTDSSKPSPYLNPTTTLPRTNSSESASSQHNNSSAHSPPHANSSPAPPSSSTAYPSSSSSSSSASAPPPLSLDPSRSQSPHPQSSYPALAPSRSSNDTHLHSHPPQLQHSHSQPHFPSQLPPPPPLLHSQSQMHPNQNQPQIMVPLSLLQSMSSQLQLQQQQGGGGFQVPGGLMSYYQAQTGGPMDRGRIGGNGQGQVLGQGMAGQGMNGMVPAQYTNRHLFIGNLPFNCQWQELKDLMRGAGSVLRADIAQGPDGRSRGFGSVLFSTPIDAERAVQLFNGYEFQGRTLKVHFDKFSGAGINQPSPLSNHPSEHNRNGGGSYRQDGPPLPQYPHQNQQSNAQIGRDSSRGPSNYPSSEQQRQQQEYMAQQQRQQQGQQGGGAQFAYSAFQGTGEALQRDLSSRPGTAQAPIGSPSPSLQARQPPTMSGENGPTTSSSIEPTTGSSSSGTQPTSSTSSGTSPSLLRQNAGAPSRIAMPPPLPFGNGNNGPFSPMRTNLPPMTPSMPAFTFGGFSAQTPPIHPHALFSPGIGPFSPQMGSPFFGPGQGMGHFQNVAPGAPSPGFGFNPMFPAFPPTPNGHPMQQPQLQQQHHQQQQQQEPMYPINGGDHPTPQAAPSNSAEASYFPPVPSSTEFEKVRPPSSEASTPDAALPQITNNDGRPHSSSSTRNSRPYLMASASQPLESVSAPSLSPELSMDGSDRPRLPQHSVSDNLAIDLARQLKLQEQGGGRNGSNPRISAGGVIAQPGWAEESDSDYEEDQTGRESEVEIEDDKLRTAMEKTERRKSFVPPSAVTTESSSSTPGGKGSAGSPGKLGVDQGSSQGVRRASFEDASRKRPAFGSSIWG